MQSPLSSIISSMKTFSIYNKLMHEHGNTYNIHTVFYDDNERENKISGMFLYFLTTT